MKIEFEITEEELPVLIPLSHRVQMLQKIKGAFVKRVLIERIENDFSGFYKLHGHYFKEKEEANNVN